MHAHYAGRGLPCFRSFEELLYATALHPMLEAYGPEEPGDHGLKQLGHYVADDQYEDGADQLRDVAKEGVQALLE
jgi:hypothetical protein